MACWLAIFSPVPGFGGLAVDPVTANDPARIAGIAVVPGIPDFAKI